jgi:hypothetical protein
MNSRMALAVFAAIGLAGLVLGWNRGRLPLRAASPPAAGAAGDIAVDLALYRAVIADVRGGKSYYAAARERIPQFGFPIASPLNWRLPTYAWLLSRLPNLSCVQFLLVALAILALFLAFTARAEACGIGIAGVTALLLFGVVRWAIDGYAFLAQEPWAATLILISLAAHARRRGASAAWRSASVAAGIAALMVRELALPYCGVACLLAAYDRRWREAAAWSLGILLFFVFFAWHVAQVRAQLAGTEIAADRGLDQWLRFGGLDFVLLTTRLNSLLFAAPGWLLWSFLLASLLGLAHERDETSRLACLASLAYLVAFACVGRPENFYWGLLPAPLLAWGTAGAPRALAAFWHAAFGDLPATGSPLASRRDQAAVG